MYGQSEKLLHFFGYVKNPAHPDNNTPFFDYQNRAAPDSVAQYRKFADLNVKAMQMRKN